MTTHDLSALRIQRDTDDADRPRRGRRTLLWLAVLLAIVAAGWVAWRGDWLPRAAPEVRVARPRLLQAGGVEERLTATGYLVPQLKSVVSSQVSGRLEWLGVDEGSRVKKGDVIARLFNIDLAAMVAEARASVAQARANLEQARASLWEAERELARQQELFGDGITTQSAFDAAKRGRDVAVASVTAAEEAIHAAEARLDLSEANFEKTLIRAPFDGIVIVKSAEIGEMVAAGSFSGQPTGGAVVTLADFSTLEMEADINESNVSKVETGQAALVTVDAVPGGRYRGVLRQIVPAADRQKAVMQAKVRLLDPDDRLVPDMSARVVFLERELAAEEASAPPRMFVPASAIRREGAAAYVLAVRDETAVRLPVVLGETRGDLQEVTSGLRGDESIVADAADGIRAGDKVRIAS
ncbi:MAG TPA: efflux RND transporter periplasmic adaptor subunit [Candidatus Polarisedimenticolia bacterium]|nr:efflux RND transporter periplasmic adaptor subunit [Candidatus Polarisedimenticolia bacterium]